MSKPTDEHNLSSLISDISIYGKRVLDGSDEAARMQLIEAAEKLIIAARTPGENLYLTAAQPFVNGAISAAYTLGCFDTILDTDEKLTSAEEIAKKNGAEKLIVVRVMRVLTSSHVFVEAEPERYHHNHMSRILSNPANRAHFYMQNSVLGPSIATLGDYLESHCFASPSDHHDSPFQFAQKTQSTLWEYLKENPAKSKIFNDSMRSSAIVGASGVPPFPFLTELTCDPDEVLIVDIGGGKGQALQAIHDTFPDLRGRMILQDLPEVIEDARVPGTLMPRIETMASDFFKPQPVKAAKAYFMRRIMHDWDDEAAKSILRNIVPSMSADSKVLINDLVLPDIGCGKRMAMNDMVMMSFGGMERSQRQWQDLLQAVGLKIKKIWSKAGENLSVIEAVSLK